MVTGISPAEHVGDAVRRLAHRRLEPAVDALQGCSEADLDDVVHDVRKRCKRVRALLRLVRDDLGKDVYRQENRTLRDAARLLSPVRDAAVLVGVHDEVVEAGGRPEPGLRIALVERHRDLRRQVLGGDTLPKVREGVATVLTRIETWPISTVEWDVLASGLERVYRRGRKAMAAAFDDPSTETFHDWRNRAKYLRHQLGFLEDLWPEVVGGSAKCAHALTDVLGDAHDLAVLGRAAAAATGDPDDQTGPFDEFIQSHRELLRARSRPLGLRLYAEKPSRFIARLGRYWEARTWPAAAA